MRVQKASRLSLLGENRLMVSILLAPLGVVPALLGQASIAYGVIAALSGLFMLNLAIKVWRAADAEAAVAVHTPNVMQTMMMLEQARFRAQAAQKPRKSRARSGENRQEGCSGDGEGQRCYSKRST
jgi:threonine/homoserine/homoserine lactone efflux protein